METLLGERIAQLFWRLRRVLRFETERLSHTQRALMPYIANLDAKLRERTEREAWALGREIISHTIIFDERPL